MLRRSSPYNVSFRYKLLSQGTTEKFRVHWSFEDDRILIEYVLRKHHDEGLKEIGGSQSYPCSFFSDVKHILMREEKNCWNRWTRDLKPILAAHHLGRLHYDPVYDFMHLHIQRRTKTAKEIHWPEMERLFPGQTTTSLLGIALNVPRQLAINSYGCTREMPLYEQFAAVLHVYKNRKLSVKKETRKEEFVKFYIEKAKEYQIQYVHN